MPKIQTWPREEAVRSAARMDEAVVFSCAFDYPERAAAPKNLSEALSARYRLDWRSCQVHLGDVTVMFTRYQGEARFLLAEVESFCNVDRWPRERLAPVPHGNDPMGIPPVHFVFQDAAMGADGPVNLGGEAGFVFDPDQARLRLNFGEGGAGDPGQGSWCRLADSVFLLVGPARDLLAIQFEGFAL